MFDVKLLNNFKLSKVQKLVNVFEIIPDSIVFFSGLVTE